MLVLTIRPGQIVKIGEALVSFDLARPDSMDEFHIQIDAPREIKVTRLHRKHGSLEYERRLVREIERLQATLAAYDKYTGRRD